jgi:cold shock CspA family protein
MNMRGTIVAYAARKGWGYIYSENVNIFFHISNSPKFLPVLGAVVEFELAPPFRLGQHDQAVNLREVAIADGGGK